MIEESVRFGDLFYRLMHLPYAETAEIRSIAEQIDGFAEEAPGEIVFLVGQLQSRLMLGQAPEAISIAEHIWRIGGSIAKSVEALYLAQLNALGMFKHSAVLLKPKFSLSQQERAQYPNLVHGMITAAVGLGQVDVLQRIAQLPELAGTSDQAILNAFATQMTAEGLSPHFAKQQMQFLGLIYKKSTAYEVLLSSDRGFAEIEVGIFLGGDSVTRYQLQNTIETAYDKYYESQQITPLDNFMITVYDIREHWPADST